MLWWRITKSDDDRFDFLLSSADTVYLLHILLFKEDIKITIMEFLKEEFFLNYSNHIYFFIDIYTINEKNMLLMRLFCWKKMLREISHLSVGYFFWMYNNCMYVFACVCIYMYSCHNDAGNKWTELNSIELNCTELKKRKPQKYSTIILQRCGMTRPFQEWGSVRVIFFPCRWQCAKKTEKNDSRITGKKSEGTRQELQSYPIPVLWTCQYRGVSSLLN